MAKRRSGFVSNVLGAAAEARAGARKALVGLRKEIDAARKHLDALIAEERSFRADLFGTTAPKTASGNGRRRGRPRKPKGAIKAPRKKGPARAHKYFAKLPETFSLDDVRKLAGRATGVSLAQWVRAKKVKKTDAGYKKL